MCLYVGESASFIINENIVQYITMHSAIYISIFSMTVDIFSWDKNVFKTRWILKSKVFFSAYLLIFFFLIVHVLLPFLAYIRTCQNSKHQWLTNNDVGVRSFNLKFVSAWPWPKTWKIKQFYFSKDCISEILIRWSSYFENPTRKNT